MSIRIRELGNISVLDLDGKIDINSSDIIETVGWLLNGGKTSLILNLENVDLVDYSGLSVLAIAYKNVVNHKGKMKLVRVALPVIELFKLVRLDSVFEVYSDEDTAAKSFDESTAESAHLRRKFARLDIHLKVQYKILGDQKNPKSFDGNVLNLSAAGLFIHTPYTFPINSQLEMELHLPDVTETLTAAGRVIWLADKELQKHSSPGMGVSFTHLHPEKEKLIVDYIDKNVTHRAEPE